MPYNNEYNRKLARDIDFNNRQYIAHCDNTGQGTQNYRIQISNYRGGGKGSKEYHYNSDSDESMDGGAILGLQAGTVLGGPKAKGELPTRKQIVTTSSLGAPLSTNRATIAETNDTTTANVEVQPEGNTQEGGAILGVKPVRFGTTPFGKKSYLSVQVMPPPGKMYRAGRYVSVRDLGEDDVSYNKQSRYESSSEDESSSDEEAVKKGQALLSVEIEGSAKPKSLAGLKDSSKVKDAKDSLNSFYSKLKKEGVKVDDDDEDKKDGSGRGLDLDGGKRRRFKKPKGRKPSRPSRGTSGRTSGRTSGSTSGRTSGRTNNKPSGTTSSRPSTGAPKKKSLYAKALEGISVVGKTASEIANLVRTWKQNNPLEAEEYENEGDYGQPQPEDEEPEDEEDEEDEEGEEGDEEEEEEYEEEESGAPDRGRADTDKKLSDISAKVEELGGPKTGPKWLKERDKGASDVKDMEPVGEILGFTMYSEDPVGDWVKAYSDSFGDFEGLSPEEMINELYTLQMKDKDIQAYLKQSQGASKANESRGVSSTLTSARVAPRDIGNKNKNTACLDGYNNVANANETAQRETRPVRRNATYFGQSGGYFKKTLNATRGMKNEKVLVPKAQMQGSTMSGFGKPEAQMHSSSMSGLGMPMNEKKRKAELRKMGKDELKAVASKHDVKCRGKVNGKTRTLKKNELIDAVLKCEYMKGSGTTSQNVVEINDMIQKYKSKPPPSDGPALPDRKTTVAQSDGPALPDRKTTVAQSDGPVVTESKTPGTQMVANGKPADKKLLKSAPKKNKRSDIVRKVMKEKNLSMIEASKYVKANNLY